MRELVVIRHGQSQYNVHLTTNLDSELTEEGVRQVRAAGKFLCEQFPHIQHFVGKTSPYLRCLMTARIIKEETGLDFWVDSGAREVMMTYESCHVPSRRDEFPEFIWSKYPSVGITFENETEEEFTDRIMVYENILRNDEKVLVVSHGTPSTALAEISVGQYERAPISNGTYVDNASVTYVRDGKLALFNHIAY